jgi:hypothetical protein
LTNRMSLQDPLYRVLADAACAHQRAQATSAPQLYERWISRDHS